METGKGSCGAGFNPFELMFIITKAMAHQGTETDNYFK